MKLKVFTKMDCPNCPAAKKIAEQLESEGAPVEWYDLDEELGLTEAVFYDVLSTPSLIITDKEGVELKAWRGEVPSINQVKKELNIN
ncbi:MAG: thioredoxin family protein [Candidatus Heimdallarchaeota archaeon]|nr:thioredoxin family protein [Candidatus Heimdallarchaeota archaeon]